jgi:hypothetical protein
MSASKSDVEGVAPLAAVCAGAEAAAGAAGAGTGAGTGAGGGAAPMVKEVEDCASPGAVRILGC